VSLDNQKFFGSFFQERTNLSCLSNARYAEEVHNTL
jgi:hypothetical protein